MPMNYSVPRAWRERKKYYRLEAARCLSCGRVNYPPGPVCRYCGSDKLEKIELIDEKARLITWTVIHVPVEGYEEHRPLIIGIVETLDTKARLLTRIVDAEPSELSRGMILEPVLRRIREDGEAGLIHYAITYRPPIKQV